MGWNGYFTFGGVEIINVERTAMYAHNAGAHWFIDRFKSTTLAKVLAETAYRSPFQDDNVPWADPDVPDGFGFFGVYPLDVANLDDSTRTSAVVESSGDGGNAGRLRHGTRQVVFSVLLMGSSDAAVDAGFTWLKSVLLAGTPGGCSSSSCGGAELTFFAAEPPYSDGQTGCGDDYLRTLQQVTVNSGPSVTSKNVMKDGGVAWTVTFTATANIPWHFGLQQDLVKALPFMTTDSFYATGTDPDLAGHTFTEVPCPQSTYTPVFDPNCPDLVLPPSIPAVTFGCFNFPANWKRFTFRVPASYVRKWTEMVPVISVKTQDIWPLTVMRIRIYQDPDGLFDPDATPCAHIADFAITYQPENTILTIDGRDHSVWVYEANGTARRGDGVVYDSNGMPFTWPSLSCSDGYVVTVDIPQTERRPKTSFSLVPRIR